MNTKLNDFFICIKKIIVAHQFTFDTDDIYNCPEGRNTFGLIHLLTGSLEYRFIDGRYLKVEAGDIFLLKPNDAYKVTSNIPCKHYTVNFTIDEESLEGEWIKQIFESVATPCFHEIPLQNAYVDRLSELCNIWQEKKEGFQLNAISVLYKLLYRFIRTQLPSQNNSFYLKIKPAKDYIESHWHEQFTLRDLANMCCLSVAHFRHIFTDIFKISPIDYRNSLRLLYAKDYLAEGHFSVTEVAYKCGFDDVNYFSRFFKARTGVSPKQYFVL